MFEIDDRVTIVNPIFEECGEEWLVVGLIPLEEIIVLQNGIGRINYYDVWNLVKEERYVRF